MDPRFHGPNLNSPNGFQSENQIRYIDQILMEEEDMEPPHIMLQESSAFRAKERFFYEALGIKYPPSPQKESPDNVKIEEASHSEAMADNNNKNNNVSIREFNDDVWVYTVDGRDEKLAAYLENLKIMGNGIMQQGRPKIHHHTTNRRNTGAKLEQVVDLRALLFGCARSIASGNHRTSYGLLEQIKRHSSPSGDGIQRLAHYFANGIEARLAGTTTSCHIQKFITNPIPDYLKALFVYGASSSLMKIAGFVSNTTIMFESGKATTTRVIHVIDFGILYGFQWPALIKWAAEREGGPAKLRITGIDIPQAAGIIEDTGRQLARYAGTLVVPFEYKAIAKEWGEVNVEDLEIKKGEFVAVFCSTRSMKLLDDVVGAVEISPRDMFLTVIRRINPNIFVHGIVNGSYDDPLFLYRFRELVYHYWTLFDMSETFLPRDNSERMLIERDMFGKEILNVIACEGTERVERPETYMQWQARHVRAGFVQVPFRRNLVTTAMNKVNKFYHADFVIAEDRKWLLASWKGRVMYAISCWQPIANDP